MGETQIVIGEKPEVQKGVQENDIKETLRAADEYAKLKEQNDKLEAEYIRQQELKAKIAIGGRANAGQVVIEKTKEELANEEAARILKQFGA
jgi:hypothetical protein